MFTCSGDLEPAEAGTQFPRVWPWSVFILEEAGCHAVDISFFSPAFFFKASSLGELLAAFSELFVWALFMLIQADP